MKVGRFLFVLLITLSLIYVFNSRFSFLGAPPLGAFFNPFEGFWQNAESKKLSENIEIPVDSLKAKVEVVYDERLVPHVFAQNDNDVYFAQGFVTARHRLWQMEFQTYAAAGRLSEILGKGENDVILKRDIYFRRIGLLHAAEKTLDTIIQDELAKEIVDAYTKGVNAYIQQLESKDYPLEYKLLGYTPEPWTPLKTALLLKYMAYDLSFQSDDIEMTNILYRKGEKVVNELFPNYPKRHDPIAPHETKWNFRSSKSPKVPKSVAAPEFFENGNGDDNDQEGIGSNNWAISAERSKTGYPILANDPHLALNLPSIWFEMQLVTPDMNVYGATLPGAPCVISGFNKDVAWGVTNVGSDVQDWYRIQNKEDKYEEYWHNEEWKKMTIRQDTLHIKGGEEMILAIPFTHHGPVVVENGQEGYSDIPEGCALRWIAHEPSLELLTFYKLNRARNYRDYRKALTYYTSPAQNIVFADNSKNIALVSNGRFPLKWEGQGKFILDGTNPQHDWQDWIPNAHNPASKNPERGFVSSANQFPADTLYPYYLDWKFATYERGQRINEVLATFQNATYQNLQSLQNDNLDLKARDLLPTLLQNLDTVLEAEEKAAFDVLSKWDYNYTTDKIAPTIFEAWWRNLQLAIWQDDFEHNDMIFPKWDKTGDLILLNDSIPSRWFDDINTEDKAETLSDLANISFTQTLEELKTEYGKMGEDWQWGNTKQTNINHLLDIGNSPLKAFSIKDLPTQGNKRIVNATGKRFGPSWRMVVELGKSPKAYGIYPGGQSGNPGSFYYANMIPDWQQGNLYELHYLRKVNTEDLQVVQKLTLVKK